MKALLIDENFDPSNLEGELKELYEAYRKNLEKKSTFQKLLGLKPRNLELFKERCAELTKSVKYIWFRKDRCSFEVRPIVKDKRKYLGQYDNFDDACECLKTYLEMQLQQQTG